MCRCRVIGIEIEYSLLDRVLYYLKQQKITPYDQVYTDKVSLMITVREEEADRICCGLTALSGAAAELLTVEEGFYPLEVEAAD